MITMAIREKRSISLPPELAAQIDEAAAAEGVSDSAWIAKTVRHELRLEAGRRGVAEWEAENGPLTDEERTAGLVRATAILDRAAGVYGREQ
jgi:predicted transcriptional regulator